MLPGKPAPELPTDQECDHCGRYFRASGISSHEEACPVRESDSLRYVGGEIRTDRCDDCGIWMTEGVIEHAEDCRLNTESPDCLGGAATIAVPLVDGADPEDVELPGPEDF